VNNDNVARQIRGIVRKRRASVIDFRDISGGGVDGKITWDVERDGLEVWLSRKRTFRGHSFSTGKGTYDTRVGNTFHSGVLDGDNDANTKSSMTSSASNPKYSLINTSNANDIKPISGAASVPRTKSPIVTRSDSDDLPA
jgi:hypothetical protein